MGRIRLTRAGWARVGVLAGGGMVATGSGLALGVAAALVVGGVLLATYCLFVSDVGGEGT